MDKAITIFAQNLQLTGVPNVTANSGRIQTAISITLGIMGAVALLILVLSGFRYIVSRGDPGEVAKAKMSILYALIGLVIIATAFSIVTFVVNGVT